MNDIFNMTGGNGIAGYVLQIFTRYGKKKTLLLGRVVVASFTSHGRFFSGNEG